MPRSALESGTVGEPRLARITRTIFSSRYSIHDLSRCTGEGGENFARFNMPLELGMAMARRYMGAAEDHDWLVLVPKGHAYLRFVSDLAAYDPATHEGTIDSVVYAVVTWLATRKDAVPPVTPTQILSAFPIFRAAKKRTLEAPSKPRAGYPHGQRLFWMPSGSRKPSNEIISRTTAYPPFPNFFSLHAAGRLPAADRGAHHSHLSAAIGSILAARRAGR